jgi:hypothetical protein
MSVLGIRASIDLVTPTGVDAQKVFEFITLKTRLTPLEIIQRLAAAVGSVNERIAARYASLLSFSETPYAFYRQGDGSRVMTPVSTEYASAKPRKGALIGHMLPYKEFDDALGWTEKYLKNAFEDQITADINEVTDAWLNRVDFDFAKRSLTDSENAIGSAGYDVGWAIGTGDSVNYIPPQYLGKVFDSTHSHYNFHDDTSEDWDDVIEAAVLDLTEHGLNSGLVMITSEADIAEFRALTRFIELLPERVTALAAATGIPMYSVAGEFTGVPGVPYGFYNSTRGLVALVYHERFPTDYALTYSTGSPVRPLAVRIGEGESFGLQVEVEATTTVNPKIKQVNLNGAHGIGVNDRLAAVASYLHAGAASYANPSDSDLGG